MKILYISTIYSDKEFEKVYNMCKIKPIQSIQKFNKLLCRGINLNKDIKLEVLTSPPVNRKMCKKVFWLSKKEIVNDMEYSYLGMINLPIIKFISLGINTLIKMIGWSIKNRKTDSVIICDAYLPIISNVSAIIGKIFGMKIITLYTDVPICIEDNIKIRSIWKSLLKKTYIKIDKLSGKLSNGYILLTEHMNEVVNKNNKPYIIMEGLVDSENNIENNIANKFKKFTIIYAGGLYEKFGIKNLIEAVVNIKRNDICLMLYGDGETVKYIKEKHSNSSKILYMGVKPNIDVIKNEIRSHILINPRFTNEKYTKYSFPSKTMEYMASGTPVLTTNLAGMPEEYKEYVYIIENESVDGIKNSIEKLLDTDRKELHEKGKKAQEFVFEKKNNIIQGKRIVEFIKKL